MAALRSRVIVIVALLVSVAVSSAGQSELVLVKKGDTEYHWPGCEVVRDGKDVTAMTRAKAEASGLKPHAGCDPSKQPPPEKAEPDEPVYVYVNDGGRYYHREKCERLKPDAKKVLLDKAGREYWPCPKCKPPIRKRPRRGSEGESYRVSPTSDRQPSTSMTTPKTSSAAPHPRFTFIPSDRA
ncbi:MAG TPA: hypothetical protein VFK20_01950 [Vicinamibacterales bacterium]|nr:hypothetical protein [Vicinamibacterales bacterium]